MVNDSVSRGLQQRKRLGGRRRTQREAVVGGNVSPDSAASGTSSRVVVVECPARRPPAVPNWLRAKLSDGRTGFLRCHRPSESLLRAPTFTAATAIGMNALKPIMHFQVSMQRMWADGIERFVGNYEKGLEEIVATVGEQSDKKRAA